MSKKPQSAAEHLAAEISKMARNHLVMASGYGRTLALLFEYMGEQQRRLAGAEECIANLRADVTMLRADLRQLIGTGG